MSHPNDEAPSVQGKELPETHSADGPIVDETKAERKRFATLAARAALAGHTFSKVKTGYMLSRWNQTRHFIDLDSAEALIVRMEGGKS